MSSLKMRFSSLNLIDMAKLLWQFLKWFLFLKMGLKREIILRDLKCGRGSEAFPLSVCRNYALCGVNGNGGAAFQNKGCVFGAHDNRYVKA